MKIVWKVGAPTTGRYRAFHHRSWPMAYFGRVETRVAAQITCADDYTPARGRGEEPHAPLLVWIADWRGAVWHWRRLKVPATTLSEAKARVREFYEKHPQYLPASEREDA